MDSFGKLFMDKRFSDIWTKYRNGIIEFVDDVPFFYSPKGLEKALIVYANFNYGTELLFKAIDKAIEKKIAFLRLITDDPLNLENCKHDIEYTIYIDLTKSIEDIYSSIKKATKQRINRAISNNLNVKISQDQSEFDEWWENNYIPWVKRTKYTQERYKFLKYIFKEKDLGKLFLAYLDDKIIAGLFVMFSPNKIAYVWLSSNDEINIDKCPDHFLQWEVIKWLKNNNYNYCDLGGLHHSKIFKEGFSSNISTWHSYDFQFDPIAAELLELMFKIQKKIIKKY
ncbi:MAG: GNAT family N-acetyltransferase [Thermoplasmatales archaeon]|nr:GNAT family N-acetyltransferase [Thermoplasmatales archaeon]